jgi:hypothetical protein
MNIRDITQDNLKFLLISACLLIYIFEGVLLNPFAIWNMVPLILGYWVLKAGLINNSNSILYPSIGFAIGCLVTTFFFHLTWFFDLGETKTGSSTSGLIFIFIPVFALIVGAVFALSGFIMAKLFRS